MTLLDLDSLMASRDIGAVLVPMHEAMHASFRWLTRGAKLTKGYAVKVAGREPVLLAYPMEREEAAASGLETHVVHEFGYDEIFKAAANPVIAYGEFFDGALRKLGATGSVAFFGNAPIHLYIGIADEMRKRNWAVFEQNGEDLIQLARKRKESWEVEAIRSVGERTEQVVEGVRRLLRECEAGRALLIGDLKSFVSAEISRLGLVEDHETILSQGHDAGVPHSRGDAAAPVRHSVPLIIDIFPSDRNSGYFFDLTRTFCIGKVPEPLRQIHADVLAAFELAASKMRPGTDASSYQHLVCDFFEQKGYGTMRSNASITSGYVHLLGHGVGLDIHEKPSFSILPTNRDRIESGDIVTIEPGLYFPEREIGVRIEDTFVVTDSGVETLCRSPRGLEP